MYGFEPRKKQLESTQEYSCILIIVNERILRIKKVLIEAKKGLANKKIINRPNSGKFQNFNF